MLDGLIKPWQAPLPSKLVMKTNRTQLNSSAALLERQGEILCGGFGYRMAPAHPRKDWSLPMRQISEQDGLTST
jgi:hypothetical protein